MTKKQLVIRVGIAILALITFAILFLVGRRLGSVGTNKTSFTTPSLIVASATPAPTAPANVIVFLGDGMGTNQIEATNSSLQAAGLGPLEFSKISQSYLLTTANVTGAVTDSAASATAMSTGYKTTNGKIGVNAENKDLTNVLESLETEQMAVGLLTTSFIYDASPAAFVAHVENRSDYQGIAVDYRDSELIDLLIGSDINGLRSIFADSSYSVYSTLSGIEESSARGQKALLLIGENYFPYSNSRVDKSHPTVAEMTASALAYLETDPDGLFLFVENELIDNAGHENNLDQVISEVTELDLAYQQAASWAQSHPNTTIFVVADHETGGLTQVGHDYHWSTTGHSSQQVYLYIDGEYTPDFVVDDNTDLFQLLREALLTNTKRDI